MAKRKHWHPIPFHQREPAPEVKRAIVFALLGELFYKEFCSRELQVSTPFVATKSAESHPTEKEAANE